MTTRFSAERQSQHRSLATTLFALHVGVLLAAQPLVSTTLFAQGAGSSQPSTIATAEPPAKINSRIARYSIVGALSGVALTTGYYYMSDKGERATGCKPRGCALPFLTVSGALAGLFLGSDMNSQQRALAPRAGASFEFALTEGALLAAPNAIDVRDTLLAVVSDSGAQLLTAGVKPAALRRRAAGLSSLRHVALVPGRRTLVVGTGTALWEAELITGPASRLADGAVDALASSGDAILSASGRRLRLLTGPQGADRTDSLEMPTAVSAIAYDQTSRTWWVGQDSQVVRVAVVDGALLLQTSLSVPSAPRAITTDGTWIVASLGDNGISAWRRDALGGGVIAPVRLVQEPRFAYDAALLNGELFVAGGVDGVYRILLSPAPRILGSSRQFPFATTIRSANGALWVGDRSRNSVARVVP